MQKLLYGIGALVVLLIIIGLALPGIHRTQVSTEIDAHPATVFALLNDFRRFALWSPMFDADPDVDVQYSGSSMGVGATMTWNGTIAGSGTRTIVESDPHKHIGIVMSPGEPGEAASWFDLAPGVGTTIVTWVYEADYGINIVGRFFAPMLGSIVARDYQDGLANLKELAESLPTTDFSDLQIEHLIVSSTEIAYLSTSSQPESAAISEAMDDAFFKILNFINAQALTVAGAPLSISRTFSGAELVFDAAIPVRGVDESTPRNGATVKIGFTYEGPVIRVTHTGPYRTLTLTHRKISAYLAAHGIERNGAAWESYVSDPGEVAQQDLLTYVFYPIEPASGDAQTDLTRNGGTRTGASSLSGRLTGVSSRNRDISP
ncbi:MAG: hypothetical protein GY949_01180 [Gammaproteobacteria bacterium]|nr:hypothetical protein [Gammaproteobacteria bacterium]